MDCWNSATAHPHANIGLQGGVRFKTRQLESQRERLSESSRLNMRACEVTLHTHGFQALTIVKRNLTSSNLWPTLQAIGFLQTVKWTYVRSPYRFTKKMSDLYRHFICSFLQNWQNHSYTMTDVVHLPWAIICWRAVIYTSHSLIPIQTPLVTQ